MSKVGTEQTMEVTFKSEEMRKRFLKENFPDQMTINDVVQLLDAAAEIATSAIFMHTRLGCDKTVSQNIFNEMIDLRFSEMKTARHLMLAKDQKQ